MHPPPTPEEALARYRSAGDPADLAVLFDLAAPDLFRVALHLCPDAASAEDALQETFLAVMEHPERYDPGRPVRPWLATILRHHASKGRRREARRPDPDRTPRPPAPDDPAALAATAEERERVREALQSLPEPYRGVALLRWRYGLEPAEIADVRGVPPGTVWSLLSRALKRLKVEMGALPALMAMALRPERGLEGVRRALLRRVAAQTGTAAAGVAAAATTGGLLMAGKAAACAAVVVLGAAGWFVFRGEEAAVPPSGGPVVSHTDTITPPPPPARPAVEPAPAAPAEAPLPPPVDLSKCDRDLDLFGVVVDGKDVPVAGARVRVEELPWQRISLPFHRGEWEAIPGPSTRSAPDGTFSLRLRPGQSVDLRATSPGFAEKLLQRCQAGERVKVVLEPSCAVTVLVKDEAGAPVAGASVELAMVEIDGQFVVLHARRQGRTDTGGRILLDGLPPRNAGVAADHPAFARSGARGTPDPDRTLLLEVVLRPGRTVDGRVVDDATGDPLPGAEVGIGSGLRNRVLADAGGHFRLPGWDDAEQDALVSVLAGRSRVTLRGPVPDPLEIRLVAGTTLTGRLLDHEGTPPAGATLAAVADIRVGSRQETDSVTGIAGTDGRFRLEGLRHDLPHSLVVIPAGGGARTAFEIPSSETAGGTVELGDLRIPSGAVIEGRVLGPDGAPVPRATVQCRGPSASGAAGGNTYGRREERSTDDLGRFRFPGQGPGAYTLTAETRSAPAMTRDVHVAPGSVRVSADLTALRKEGTLTLDILVVDSRGEPVPRARADARSGRGGNLVQRTTDERGAARFEGQVGDTAHLTIREEPGSLRPRFLDRTLDVPLSEAGPVRVVVEDCVLVSGTVLGPDGKAVPAVPVFAHRNDGTFLISSGRMTDGEGRFQVAIPTDEPVDLSLPDARSGAAFGNLRGALKQVRGPADGLVIQTRAIATSRTLPVVVLDAEGAPVCDASLMLLAGGRPKGKVVDSAGRAVFEGLPEDEVTLMVQRNFQAPVKSTAWNDSLPPASTKAVPRDEDVVLRFRRGTPRAFRIVHSGERPAGMAMVAVSWEDDTIAWYPADEEGRGRIVLAKEGRLRSLQASFRHPDGGMETRTLDALPDGDGEFEIRLEPAKSE